MSLSLCVFFYVILIVLDCCLLFKLFMLQLVSHMAADNQGNSIGSFDTIHLTIEFQCFIIIARMIIISLIYEKSNIDKGMFIYIVNKLAFSNNIQVKSKVTVSSGE